MKQYIVDAFTDRLFHGNQAAICVLDEWLDEELMMDITRENNFSETAFTVKEGEQYRLRWFTPGGEIDLCGHATLACAFVLMNYYEKDAERITFDTLSGELTVEKQEDFYEMDFPAYDLQPVKITQKMIDAIGKTPVEAYMGRDLMCVFPNEEDILSMTPDMDKVKELDGLLLQVTAKGSEYDCVSRTFAPKLAVTEDPVCGSGHCHIAPYWIKKLQADHVVAYQASHRGGTLYCRIENGRVKLAGKAVLFSEAEFKI